MDLKQIKELLANEDVRKLVEEQIQTAVDNKQKELDALKKTQEKEAYILRKTVLAKAELYENKLKEYYEGKFNDAKKKLGKEVYEFVSEATKKLEMAITEEAKANSKEAQLTEAFSSAVRAMAPFINVNELVDVNQNTIDGLKAKLNKALKENKELSEKAFIGGDLHTLVMKECAGYPSTKTAVIYQTVVKMLPKNLTEGKEAIEAVKKTIREQELEEQAKIKETELKALEEQKKSDTEKSGSESRTKIKLIAENIKKPQENKVNNPSKPVSIFDYEVALD